jgi:hypothetical protein
MGGILLERLLNEAESTALDFKQSQYPFENASKEQKSELLKDILAFANSWRRTDALLNHRLIQKAKISAKGRR